ncbi:MAG: neutral/alkaline non-lysosomal ceramidase N-terminal domain-containing protein [Limisphaerales bacterium]
MNAMALWRWFGFGLGMVAGGWAGCSAPHSNPELALGVARVDVTPEYPIRLTGYAARSGPSTGVAQRLWAKALAMGSDRQGPRVLVTVDNCGVSRLIIDEVARRLERRVGLKRENFAVASSHTHSGPMVRGFAANIFVRDLTDEEASAIDRYTEELKNHLEAVVVAALADRRPGTLSRGEGRVGFGANRRTAGGPVEPSLPILVARELDGRVRAVVANYACHCTTLGHQINQHHGDWAGFAQEALEQDHPGAVALITIGCGADTNPSPRGGEDFGIALARAHGRALATEASRVMASGELFSIPRIPQTAFQAFDLNFQPLPSLEEWRKRASESGIVGYHAQKNLARLDRGETLPTTLPYSAQAWRFGDGFSMVFLPGEVVVDYALRLKRELPGETLWITAYANDVPCYIPSKRILAEGGYEAESSLWYYDRPARLAPETEDLIHGVVVGLVRGK